MASKATIIFLADKKMNGAQSKDFSSNKAVEIL